MSNRNLSLAPRWIRASDWWEFKLNPPTCLAIATSLHIGQSPFTLWPAFVLLFTCLIPGAVFVSIINDITDRKDDQLAGKPNRLEGKSLTLPIIVGAASVLIGLGFTWEWRDDARLAGIYATGWIAFTAYSVPPFRLKGRGVWGALCDAIGANVVPALVAVFLVSHISAIDIDFGFLSAVTAWSLGYGLRGIFWHQIKDAEADRLSGLKSFVLSFGIERTMALTRYIVFPIECFALSILIWKSGWISMTFAMLMLGLYIWYMVERIDRFRMLVTLAKPRPRGAIILQEYYGAFLPVALIIAVSIFDPRNLVFLLFYLIVFPRSMQDVLGDAVKLFDPKYERKRDEC